MATPTSKYWSLPEIFVDNRNPNKLRKFHRVSGLRCPLQKPHLHGNSIWLLSLNLKNTAPRSATLQAVLGKKNSPIYIPHLIAPLLNPLAVSKSVQSGDHDCANGKHRGRSAVGPIIRVLEDGARSKTPYEHRWGG